VIDAIRRGNKIDAIRLLRDQTGMDLKEAKDTVEAYELAHPAAVSASPREMGERGGNGLWWIAVVAIVLIAAYYLFRRFS
jgi:hypothetical protein